MKFLVDNQLPPAIARFISDDLHVEAWHVVDAGLRDASDLDLWQYASIHDFVLVTKDDDFVTMFSKRPSARLLWVRLGNCRRSVLLKVFQKQWGNVMERFAAGEYFIELR